MTNKKADNKGKSYIQNLVDIGLTQLEAKIYLLLNERSPLTIREISQQLKIMTSSAHRAIKNLKQKGLTTTHGTRPLKIRVVSPTLALSHFAETKYLEQTKIIQNLERNLEKLSQTHDLKVEFFENKMDTYYHSIDIINNTKSEIIIFSVGEPIPQELFLALVRAIKRGVDVKMIAQKYDKDNKELLENWTKNGYKVRYLNEPELDFTLVVYDKKITDLHIRTPNNPDDRIGITIYNSGYSVAQHKYLLTLWERAKDI